MMVLFKKKKGVQRLIQVTDKVEITKALVQSAYLELMEIPSLLKVTALVDKEKEIEAEEGRKVDLSEVNLFVASGSVKDVILHTLMTEEVYIIVELATDNGREVEALMSKITLYLDEDPVWCGDEITLSRDYVVRIGKRRGVLLDCTVNE